MTTDARTVQAPSLPIAILLLIVPLIGVLQFRGIALATTLGFAAAVAMHWRARGALPWPTVAGPLVPLLAIAALATVGAAWALDPTRTAVTGLKFAGYGLLASGAARAVAEDPVAPRLLPRALVAGLAIGIALALADMLTGHVIRATVRGLAATRIELVFGLKPAVSVIAVLLPLAVVQAGIPLVLRAGLVAAGLAAAAIIPAEAAKISAVVGLAVLGLACLARRWSGLAVGAGIGAAILAAPLILSVALPRIGSLESIPPSAAHRVLIWEFVGERIADRPLLGWGAESSRIMPGGKTPFEEATIQRFGLTSEASRAWFRATEPHRLPLHPHNAALQIWLELGLVGAALAAWLALALGRGAGRAGPATVGALAAGAVTGMLSYGVWQEWWIGFVLLVVVTIVGLRGAVGERVTSAGGSGA